MASTLTNRGLAPGQESGLGLVEILVAMMLFMVVIVGVAGTLTAGLASTMHTRLQTIGKSKAQEQFEEMRSRVFYVPFSANPDTGTETDIDLLDYYFPDLATYVRVNSQGWSGQYDAATATYTLESPPDPGTGIVITVESRFVDSATMTVTPAASYDSNREGYDTPPSSLLAVTVRASWADRTGDNAYQLDSLISSMGQTVQGAGNAGGEQGCTTNSSSDVTVSSVKFMISTGTGAASASFIEGGAGEADAEVYAGCETGALARVSGSEVAKFDAATQSFVPFIFGAGASANDRVGPESSGPLSAGPLTGWPSAWISGSRAQTSADAAESDLESEAQSALANMTVSIEQVDGWPGEPLSGYRTWDFLNPVIAISGGSDQEESDPDYQDEQAVAALTQLNGLTTGRAKVYVRQVDILPLEATSADTPSALQGLVFVRDFRARAVSEANGQSGGAANPVMTYSATIGVFNAASAPNCSGDECYDLYATVGPENPIETAISLSTSGYRLQNALFTEFHSHSTNDIRGAVTADTDGTSASVSLSGGLMWVGAAFGTEVRWKTDNPLRDQITLVNQQGTAWIWLGEMSTSLFQE